MEETVQETDLKRARKLEPDSRAEGLQRGERMSRGSSSVVYEWSPDQMVAKDSIILVGRRERNSETILCAPARTYERHPPVIFLIKYSSRIVGQKYKNTGIGRCGTNSRKLFATTGT